MSKNLRRLYPTLDSESAERFDRLRDTMKGLPEATFARLVLLKGMDAMDAERGTPLTEEEQAQEAMRRC